MATMNTCIAVVGINAVGKSNFGKRLASTLRRSRRDTDALFRQKLGDVSAFIAQHGWDQFRRAKERIVLEALQPSHVVVLGGGAISSAHVRRALREQCIVVWLRAGPDRVLRHLREARRPRPEFPPPITRGAVVSALRHWDPLFREVATVTINEHVPFARQVDRAMKLLKTSCPGVTMGVSP